MTNVTMPISLDQLARRPVSARQSFPLISLEPQQQYQAMHTMSSDFEGLRTTEEVRRFTLIDRLRLDDTIAFLKNKTVLEALQVAFGRKIIGKISQQVTFDHSALLLAAPPSLVSYWLKLQGFVNATVIPSYNVVRRLGVRHGKPCPTAILRAEIELRNLNDKDSQTIRRIEIFLPAPAPQAWNQEIIQKEQTNNYESHTAFVVNEGIDIKDMRIAFLRNGLKPDGGGINPVEDSTTLYFINEEGKRFELIQYCKTEQELANLHEIEIDVQTSPEEY